MRGEVFFKKSAILLWVGILFFGGCSLPSLVRSPLETFSTFRFFQTATTDYAIRFNVTGLASTGLAIRNGSDLVRPTNDGTYTFATRVVSGTSYNVSIETQPSNPTQACRLRGESGTVTRGDVSNIEVLCDPALASDTVSGTITGLAGSGLTLSNTTPTGTQNITINSTSFSFSSQAIGTSYSISIVSQPTNPSQTCTLGTGATGTMATGGVRLTLTCTTDSFPVRVRVVGIQGLLAPAGQLNLMLNGSTTLAFQQDGTQTFTEQIASGSTYTVVTTNSPGGTSGIISTGKCTIPSNTGVVGASAVTVLVNCSNGFTVQGTITNPGGSASSIIGSGLQVEIVHNGSGSFFPTERVSLAPGSTQLVFSNPIPAGSGYEIQVVTHPSSPTQTCSIPTGSMGTISGEVTNVQMDCFLPVPGFSIAGGTVNNDPSFSLTNLVSGFSEFRYTTGNGTQPNPTCSTGTAITTGNLTVSGNNVSTIFVIQCPVSSTWTVSEQSSIIFALQVATPVMNPTSGSLLDAGTQIFSTTTTTGPTYLCYTVGTTTPTDPVCGLTYNTCTTGTLGNYTYPGSGTRIVKNRYCKENYTQSSVSSGTYNPNVYNVGGTISGLTTPFGSGSFVLRLNGGNDLTIAANGSFTFGTSLASGESYAVTVHTSPTSPWQTCNVTNGSGTISSSSITNVSISCTINQYTMTGTVTSATALPTGLSVTNGTQTLSISPGGTSTPVNFSTPINSGTVLNFQVVAEPPGWACSASNETTVTLAGANLTNVNFLCVSGYRAGNGIVSRKLAPMSYHYYRANVEAFAGTGASGFVNSSAFLSTFAEPMDITYDGSSYYVVDSQNHAIRRINASNTVTTVAGSGSSGNDSGTTGDRFNLPRGIATNGTFLFVSEQSGHRIKRVRLSDGNTETIAGDNSTLNPTATSVDDTNPLNARFNTPSGLALDGTVLYIAERGANSIRRMNLTTGAVTTLVTGGSISSPEGITHFGDFVYVANSGNHTIVRVNKSTGVASILAGSSGMAAFRDDTANNALFNVPIGIATDGIYVYVSDSNNNRLRKIEISTQKVMTLAGMDAGNSVGTGTTARFSNPRFLLFNGTTLALSLGNQIRNITTGASDEVRAHFPSNGVYTNLNPSGSAATVTGSPTFLTGRYAETEGALQFNTGSSLTTTALIGATNSTIAAWVFWDGTLTGSAQIIFHNGLTNLNGSGLFIDNATGRLFVLQGGGSNLDAGIRLPGGTWVHLALVKQTNLYTVYANGKPVFQATFSETSPTTEFRIGNGVSLSGYFAGRIADVRIITRAWDMGELHHVAKQANSALVGAGFSTHPDELVMHYRFNNSTAAEGALGGTGTGNAITPTPDAGRQVNSAYRFDGTTSTFTASPDGLPLGNTRRSVCLKVFPSRYPDPGTTFPLFQYGNTSVGGLGFSLRMGNLGGIQQLLLGGVASADASANFALPLHRWSTVCGVFNFSTVQIFVNGVSLMSPTSVAGMNTAAGNVRIGHDGTTNFFQGKLDEVMVYAKALSAFEVRLLSSQIPVGLVAYYDFNGDNNDVSGFSNNADNGTTAYVSNRDGQFPGALSFNGSQGLLVDSMEILPRANQPRTMCSWINVTNYSSLRTIASYGNVSASNLTHLLVEASYANFAGFASDVIGFHYNVLNRWVHLCGSYDGATIRIYIHGALHGSNSASWNTTIGNFRIGRRVDGTLPFVGSLDDLMIWNRALSDDEIKSLAGNHPTHVASWNSTVASSNLKLHYVAESLSNLSNGSSVTSWPDHSGNGFDLNNTSAAPSFQTNGNNGRPGVQFSSAGSQFIRTTVTATIGTSDSTTFFVFKRNSLTNGVLMEAESTNGLGFTLNNNRLVFGAVHPTLGIELGGTGRIVQSTAVFNSTTDSWVTQIRHSVSTSASILRLGEDITGTTTPSITNAGGVLGLGRGIANGGTLTYFDGVLSEVIRFNNNLVPAENIIISCYLSSRYGLIGTIPLVTCD